MPGHKIKPSFKDSYANCKVCGRQFEKWDVKVIYCGYSCQQKGQKMKQKLYRSTFKNKEVVK